MTCLLGPGRRLTSLFLAFVLTRTLLALSLLIDREVVGANDIWRYHAVAERMWSGDGVRVWEYPLGSLWMTVPPLLLGGQEQLDYFLRFVGLALVVDAATLAMVYRIAPRRSANVTGAWLWVAAPPVLGLITLTRLDIAACCFAAAGLGAAARDRWRWSSAFAGLGAAIKVWPLLIAMISFLTPGRRRDVVTGLAVSTGLVAVTSQAFGAWSLSASFLQYQDDRGLQVESFGALPFLWFDRFGLADYRTEFEFGAQQISGPGTGFVATMCSVLMVLAIAFVLTFVRSRRLASAPEVERLVVLLTLCVCVLVVTNKVFSGQYLLWLILVVSAQAGFRSIKGRTIASLIVSCALTHAYFPFMYGGLVSGDLLPLTLLTLRDAVLVYVVWQVWADAMGTSRGRQTMRAPHNKVSA